MTPLVEQRLGTRPHVLPGDTEDPLTIERIERPGDDWDSFVSASERGTPFHESGWLRALEEAYGHRPRHLWARVDGEVCGALPLFEVRGPFTGRALISIPYAVYGGAVADSVDIETALCERARSLADKEQVRYLELRSGSELEGFQHTCHYFTFRKELPGTTEELLPSLPKKARAAVRKAEETYQLTVEFGHHLFETFYALYTRSLRRLASPPHSLRFLKRLLAEYQDRCVIEVVFHEREPVAAVMSLQFRDTMLPYFAGIDARFSRMNTSNMLYFSLMQESIRRGLRVFDFGRTRQDNDGGCSFKRNQGYEPEPLHYAFHTPTGAEIPDLRPSNRKFSVAQTVWKRLPVGMVSRLGGRVTKWLP